MGDKSARQRGQGNVEYVGVVLAVMVLVGVVVVAVPGLGRAITCQIERAITQSGSCSEPVEVSYGQEEPEPQSGNEDDRAAQGGNEDDRAVQGGNEDDQAVQGGNGDQSAGSPPPGIGSGNGNNNNSGGQYNNARPGSSCTGHRCTPGGVNQNKVTDALEDVRDALDGGFFGVRSGDLDDAMDAVWGLNGAELDSLVAQMSDDELDEWFDQLDDGTAFGGWNSEKRRELLNLFASQASKGTLDRLARFTDELQPDFDKVGDKDKPDSVQNQGQYGELPHQLFINGVQPEDVAQGDLGDCWWVASMMAVAQADPQVIKDAITANPNGTYTVRLFDDGKPVYVTVTPEMVLHPNGDPFLVDNDNYSGGDYELWPMVLEKALAVHYGDFDDIESNTADVGMTTLTGLPSSNTDPGDLSLQELRDVLDNGGAVALSSQPTTKKFLFITYQGGNLPSTYSGNNELIQGHAYYVSDVDVARGTVTVVNPWGTTVGYPPRTLTYQEFVSSFRKVRTNEVSQ